MQKADRLRRWLTAYIPYLKEHPDKLQIYIESGTVNARRSATLSFSYGYTVKALFLDYAGDANDIIVPLLAWIQREQPALMRKADSQPFGFEAQLLDATTADVEFSIDLTESVLVNLRADGSGYDITALPEPDFTDAFAGVTATFSDAFAGDEPLMLGGTD
ncbi:phage tail protein [uncultured Novosphingobium sp.]|uniref:phage tail protein n=1 Tax=uncultured Novosphingobium sp. TaxID=292277 RepID=UPI0025994D24|nr:phage tail protein [uncultured Novosphingobium sp.]